MISPPQMAVPDDDGLPPAPVAEARARRKSSARLVLLGGSLSLAVVMFTAFRAHPSPGLHGSSLAITIALAGLAAGMVRTYGGLAWLALKGEPWRAFDPNTSPQPPRVYLLALVLLLASSGVLASLQPEGPGLVGMIMAVAVATRMVPGRPTLLMVGACAAFLGTLALAGGKHGVGGQDPALFSGDLTAFVLIYIVVLFARRIRQQEQEEARLLARLRESRGAELRAAALAERQRLARDMHDVLAHSLSGLVVQLEGARLLAASDPGDARMAVAVDRAHQLAKNGLEEARQAIGMLRGDELPGPSRLAALAAEFEADTGVRCEFAEEGPRRELGSAVRLALYRVTQEALANARKHAVPDRVGVRLEYLPHSVTLAVEDRADGPSDAAAPAAAAGPGGYGITGMKERAGLLGGSLTAGPTGHGFRVLLKVPA